MTLGGLTKNKKDLLRIYSYFLLVCFLLIVFLAPSLYWYSAKTLEESAIEYNENMLSQLNKSVDAIMNEVDKSLGQLVIDFSIADYMDYYKNNDILMLYKINSKLANYYAISSYIHSVDIYYSDADCVLTYRQGVKKLEEYEERNFIMNMKNNVISIDAITKRRIYDHFSEKHEDVITVVKPIPLMYYVPKAFIVVNIAEKYLADTIDSINGSGNIQILMGIDKHAVTSNKMDVISGDRDTLYQNLDSIVSGGQGSSIQEIEGQRVLITHTASEKYGWKFIAIIPYRVVVEKITYFKYFSIIIACAVLLFGIFVSSFFTGKLYKPLQSIALLFKNNGYNKQEYGVYEYITKNIDHMIEKNRTLEEDLRQYQPVLMNHFINGLLKGTVEEREEIGKQLEYYRLDIGSEPNYVVFIISIDNYKKQLLKYSQRQKSALSVYLVQVLYSLVRKEYQSIVCETGINEITVIANLPVQPSDELLLESCRELGRKIKKAVTENMKFTVTVGMGEVVNDITEISGSYYKALQAIQYAYVIGFDKLIAFEQIKKTDGVDFRHVFKLEGELVNALKQGKTKTALEILDLILLQDIKRNNEYVIFILFQLLSTIIKSIYELGGDLKKIIGQQNIFEELLKLNDLMDVRVWFERLFIKIVHFVEEKKNPENGDIVSRIKDYIASHYAALISLDTISEMVFLSPSYVSKIFKDETGICLKEYINSVRMDNAKKMLSYPDYAVYQIAERVGYDKVKSFIKAFKKYTGMTPGEYRMTLISS